MNELVKRGFNAYKIFMKNKIAMSLMMLISGVMMFVAALNGHGNDTKTMPLMVSLAGAVFAFWSLYRLGYIKSEYDKMTDSEEKKNHKKMLYLQICESLLYVVVAAAGIFLLCNENMMDKALNLMAGGFTTFNGILGAINACKNRHCRDFRWKFMLVMTAVELVAGLVFVFAPSISINGYIIMGGITIVAGTVEVISAFTKENFKCTIQDGKDIVQIIKKNEK